LLQGVFIHTHDVENRRHGSVERGGNVGDRGRPSVPEAECSRFLLYGVKSALPGIWCYSLRGVGAWRAG
jgi:hypothetical protein